MASIMKNNSEDIILQVRVSHWVMHFMAAITRRGSAARQETGHRLRDLDTRHYHATPNGKKSQDATVYSTT